MPLRELPRAHGDALDVHGYPARRAELVVLRLGPEFVGREEGLVGDTYLRHKRVDEGCAIAAADAAVAFLDVFPAAREGPVALDGQGHGAAVAGSGVSLGVLDDCCGFGTGIWGWDVLGLFGLPVETEWRV